MQGGKRVCLKKLLNNIGNVIGAIWFGFWENLVLVLLIVLVILLMLMIVIGTIAGVKEHRICENQLRQYTEVHNLEYKSVKRFLKYQEKISCKDFVEDPYLINLYNQYIGKPNGVSD